MRARLAAFISLAALAALPVQGAEETKVQTPEGQNMTVRTDESGTTVSHDGPAAASAAQKGVTPSEAQHRDAVNELTEGGGAVRSEESKAR